MTPSDLFTADFAERPHWWDLAAPEACDEGDLPPTADVAIVGSGYTSLVAALQLARAGRSVLVLEAERAGHGPAADSQDRGPRAPASHATTADTRRW